MSPVKQPRRQRERPATRRSGRGRHPDPQPAGQFNALSAEMLAALQASLDDLAGDEGVRCVVLGASGRAFCASHDLKEMRAHPCQDDYEALFARCSWPRRASSACPSRSSPACRARDGGGCQLVASCDLAVAARARVRGLRHRCRPVLLDPGRGPVPQRLAQARLRHAGHRALHLGGRGAVLRPRQPHGAGCRARRGVTALAAEIARRALSRCGPGRPCSAVSAP